MADRFSLLGIRKENLLERPKYPVAPAGRHDLRGGVGSLLFGGAGPLMIITGPLIKGRSSPMLTLHPHLLILLQTPDTGQWTPPDKLTFQEKGMSKMIQLKNK